MFFEHDTRRDPTAASARPVLLGYQTTRLGAEPSEAARKHVALLKLARRQGFQLGQIFDENDVNRPCAALVCLITAARAMQVKAVAVPTSEDLGLAAHVQRLTRQRIESEAGVQVIIAWDGFMRSFGEVSEGILPGTIWRNRPGED
jgi:hypothetical protein